MNTIIPHPHQPLIIDNGVIRFKKNRIIRTLCNMGRINLDKTCLLDVNREDHCQLSQLLGYSVSGYGGLSHVTSEEAEYFDSLAEEFIKNFNPVHYSQHGHPPHPTQPIISTDRGDIYKKNLILSYLHAIGDIDLSDIRTWLISNNPVPAGYDFLQLQQLIGYPVSDVERR